MRQPYNLSPGPLAQDTSASRKKRGGATRPLPLHRRLGLGCRWRGRLTRPPHGRRRRLYLASRRHVTQAVSARIRLIIQTIRWDRSGSVWIDEAPRRAGQIALEPTRSTPSTRLRTWRSALWARLGPAGAA